MTKDAQQAQQLLAQAQVYQQQMQNVFAQKEALNMQLKEINNALEELEKSKEDIFKISGPILVKTDKAAIKKELKEKAEIMELRVKTLESGEKKLKTRFEDIREKLSKMM